MPAALGAGGVQRRAEDSAAAGKRRRGPPAEACSVGRSEDGRARGTWDGTHQGRHPAWQGPKGVGCPQASPTLTRHRLQQRQALQHVSGYGGGVVGGGLVEQAEQLGGPGAGEHTVQLILKGALKAKKNHKTAR